MATTHEKIINEGTLVLNTKTINNGNEIPANILPKDTYLVINNTTKNIPNAPKAAWKCKAKTKPNKVAIPLPPLNPAKTGKICPMTAAKPKANLTLVNGTMLSGK